LEYEFVVKGQRSEPFYPRSPEANNRRSVPKSSKLAQETVGTNRTGQGILPLQYLFKFPLAGMPRLWPLLNVPPNQPRYWINKLATCTN